MPTTIRRRQLRRTRRRFTLSRVGSSSAAIQAAAGVLSAQALAGRSTARGAIGAVAGIASAQALAGRSTARSAVGAASPALSALDIDIITNGYSIRFYGSDPVSFNDVDHVRIPLRSGANRTPVDVGDSDFTYEALINCLYANNTTTSTTDWRFSNIFLDRDVWNGVMGHGIGVTRDGSNLVVVFGVAGVGLTHTSIVTTSNIGDGAWHHVAVVRQQSTGVIRIYIDGTQEASGTYSTGDLRYDGSASGGQNNDQIVLGREKHDLGSGFNGSLDEIRISNSRRYTSGFTPTTRPHPVDSNAMALYHADSASGTTLIDGTAGGTNGTLFVGGPSNGPVWSSEVAFLPGGAGMAQAVGTVSTAALTGRAGIRGAMGVAAGVATAQALTGRATARGAVGAASGAVAAQSLAGRSSARASVTSAPGVLTASLAGKSTARAATGAAAAALTTQTLVPSGSGAAVMSAAACTLTVQPLTGRSVGRATLGAASIAGTAQTLAGRATARAALSAAVASLTAASMGPFTPVTRFVTATLKARPVYRLKARPVVRMR